MSTKLRKNKPSKKIPLALSPLGFALAACGGETEAPIVVDDTNSGGAQQDGTDVPQTISFTSVRIDYDVTGFTGEEINKVAAGGSDSKIFLPDRDVGNLIITPHQDSLNPDGEGANRYFPLIEYTLTDNEISVHRIIDGFDFVGSKPIDELSVNGTPAILLGGHGPEYTDGRDWPFGALWVAKLNPSSEIEYEQISTDNAFYHGISAGDINGDGLDDVVAVHMGSTVLDGPSYGSVHFFIQNEAGVFSRELLYSENPSINGGSSILVSDLDNDGQNEILVATYGNGFSLMDIETTGEFTLRDASYSFHIMKYDAVSGNVSDVATMPLGGSMLEVNDNGGFGVIDIAEIDLDMDGDNDLLMLLETDADFSVELYRNDGSLNFTLITQAAFENSYFNGTESFFRHINVVDIQGDGLPDFVFSGFNWWDNNGPVDLGQFVYINEGTNSFKSLGGYDELMLDPSEFELNDETSVVRTINFVEANNGELHFLLTQGGITAMDFIDVTMNVTDYIA